MGLIEMVILASALAMDAVAVAIAIGAKYQSLHYRFLIVPPLMFGLFQGLMPTIGYYLGATFASYIQQFDHIIALVVLGGLGTKMIYESFQTDELDNQITHLSIRDVLALAFATSLDALAVGVTFAFWQINIFEASAVIGFITAFLAIVGVLVGFKMGSALENKAEMAGGMILIAIGVKIFIEHTLY